MTGMVYDSGTYIACLLRAMDALNLAHWRRRRDEVIGSGSGIRAIVGVPTATGKLQRGGHAALLALDEISPATYLSTNRSQQTFGPG